MDVIDIINEEMHKQGTTITHVATNANMTIDALSKCLRRTRRLRADEFVDIARVLRLDVTRFIGITKEENKAS